MAIFLTGSTGYIGAHVAANLLRDHGAALNVLVRAHDVREAEGRLWQALQLHLDFTQFYEYLQTRMRIFRGDLTDPGFGLGRDEYDRLVHTTDSVIHCAASLNRKSEKSCLNVNLRGTLEVLTLARHAEHYHGLRRFSQVSTVAVAGKRQNEVVTEDRSIDWERSDYDPYARTKKFCEHMMHVLLPETPKTIFRPSIVLGDSRHAETTQFDMVRAFVFLAGLPALPFRPTDKIDIVNVDFVADAVATLHQKDQPKFDTYHLSSGVGSQSFREITRALASAQNKRPPVFVPVAERPFAGSVNILANRKGAIGKGASLLKVFMPYLLWNTVFDNTRVTTELGKKPVPFSEYSFPLLKFSTGNNFAYSYRPWPAAAGGTAA
ncbi:MAG TPA: SDR family oxidoreductase [Candidatus Aquilonibacter sp.]|jgi:thioester reductase-like protein|nr:SDR family oxidoreductase [Candidatus Aquilonibacter sp.]